MSGWDELTHYLHKSEESEKANRVLTEENSRLRTLLTQLGKNGCWCGQPPGSLQGEHSMLCRAIREAVGT